MFSSKNRTAHKAHQNQQQSNQISPLDHPRSFSFPGWLNTFSICFFFLILLVNLIFPSTCSQPLTHNRLTSTICWWNIWNQPKIDKTKKKKKKTELGRQHVPQLMSSESHSNPELQRAFTLINGIRYPPFSHPSNKAQLQRTFSHLFIGALPSQHSCLPAEPAALSELPGGFKVNPWKNLGVPVVSSKQVILKRFRSEDRGHL